ncbi:hypothetical protein [Aureitalea sp. L0-47]|uniref:hypothetical protein n=1 Tax=Aureitalea sp. L0-47 TaxID=2816962 RepID=UPI0022386F0F|nr:hypothetical protein [Aureitalea sp. L0-47]
MMKTRIRIKDVWKLMMLIAFAITATSCFGDDDGVITEDEIPELTLKVTNCSVENIGIVPEVKVLGGAGRWTVEVNVNITCMGEPVNEAELKVKWGWIERAVKIETDEEGKARARRKVTSTARPSGKVTITIEGDDGEKPVTVDF